MKESDELKEVLKWVGVAILAAIPIYIIVKKIAVESEYLYPDSDIFAEELEG